MTKFTEFVRSELKELESKDINVLFSCIKDNLEEMGQVLTQSDDKVLYNEIERNLK